MLRPGVSNIASRLIRTPRNNFGLFKALMHLVRTTLNKIRWEENQQFTALEKRASNLPKSAEQASQLFVLTEQKISLSEEGRLQRIDQILGTKTHFHEGKIYQERIDSDHLMEIEQLKKQNPQPKRSTLNWLNPQADVKLKFKNKRKYYNLISKLSSYPTHKSGSYDLGDEVNDQTIAFLAAETAFSTISLKPVELTASSLEQESLLLPPEAPFSSQRYCYFRPQFSMQLLRVSKNLYNSSLLTDPLAIAALDSAVEEVISLEEIYETLKNYDTDERVNEYLKKVQNNRIEYFFADFAFDSSENIVAITIDILDNGIQHCLLVKSLVSKQTIMRPVFNMKPPVTFSSDGRTVFYIQRSGQGGWIQLVKRPVESCWGKNEIIVSEEDQGIIYRCSPQKQLSLGKDTNRNFVFLTLRDYGKPFSENLFVVSQRQDKIHLLTVDQEGGCKYFYDMSPLGLIICKKRKVESGQLKFGNNEYYIENVQLIPFKEHIQIQTEKLGLTQLLPGSVSKASPPNPEELDFTKRKYIFMPDQHQFITQVEVRSTHLIMVINYASVYDRAILYFLPFKPNAHPHSLLLKGGSQLTLRSNNYTYNSQQVQFTQPQGLIHLQKVYNIWKRELKDDQREASRYHHETINVTDCNHPFQLHFICKNIYIEEQDLPVVLVLTSKGEQMDQQVLRQFLQKGVAVIQFCGRGTTTKDLQHFLQGSRHNYNCMLDDLQAAIEFIGNKLTQNISLYCKGQISSLAGLWFNIYFPYLFNASILHNGLYDLSDETALANCRDFLGNLNGTQDNSINRFEKEKFNVLQHKFRNFRNFQEKGATETQGKFQIGQLQNIIISSDRHHRVHSRKLIRRLRENYFLKYDTVFLKEYEDSYSTDLFNLSFLYSKIRSRLERQINQLPQEDSEDN